MIDNVIPGVDLALAQHFLAIVEVEPYGYRRLILEAKRTISLGSAAIDEPGSVFEPTVVARGERIDASLIISIIEARPVFSIFRRTIVEHELHLMYCIDGRLWMLRRDEAEAIYHSVQRYRPHGVQANLFAPSIKPDVLQVFPGSATSDFAAATYVTVEPEEA